MANLDDAQLRAELKLLTGKETAPVTASTRHLLVAKLLKLRKENEKNGADGKEATSVGKNATPTSKAGVSDASGTSTNSGIKTKVKANKKPLKTTLGFSSDEGERSESESKAAEKSRATTRKSVGLKANANTHKPTGKIELEGKGDQLSNKEIQDQLLELTGTRYPISESTRRSLLKKLNGLLAKGHKPNIAAATPTTASKKPTVGPMESQFSDSDEEMDYETSPIVPQTESTQSVRYASQAVNTSSFLDQTLPDPPDDEPDCIVVPPPGVRLARKSSDSHVSSTNPAPDPNESLCRLTPSRARNPPPVIEESVAVPPSPPRSVYARRPLRTSTNFINLNAEVTPQPTRRFAATIKDSGVKLTPSSVSATPDYSTRFSAGGPGSHIDADVRKLKAVKDANMAKRENGEPLAVWVSRAMLYLLAMFLIGLSVFYLYTLLTQEVPLESLVAPEDYILPLLCDETKTRPEGVPCFTDEELRRVLPLAKELRHMLSDHAGRFECQYTGYESRKISQSEAKVKMVDRQGKDVHHLWKTLEWLIIKNPHWQIRLTGNTDSPVTEPSHIWWMEATEADQPLLCSISQVLHSIITLVIIASLVVAIGYGSLRLGRYWKRMKEEETTLVYDIVENIIDLLENQARRSREDAAEQPYLAISHVHDTLISPQDRKKMRHLWQKAVAFLKENETRVREEVQQVHGEEFAVWRWLQADPKSPISDPQAQSGWQGSAFSDRSRQKLNFRPTHCIKIRNMFDISCQCGPDWPKQIEDAILKKLGEDHGVVHIAVDTQSLESRVYAKFLTAKHAGRAFESLNGSYYRGECVQCKFLLEKKYFQRFPHAEFAGTVIHGH